jgi:hypothetical protein
VGLRKNAKAGTAYSGNQIVTAMTDLIYIAVVTAIFVAAQLYAHWCGKL